MHTHQKLTLKRFPSGIPTAHTPFKAHSAHKCHETFSFMMSLSAMSLGLRFCMSRKGGTGEMGGCTRRVQTAWPRLGSSLEVTYWH